MKGIGTVFAIILAAACMGSLVSCRSQKPHDPTYAVYETRNGPDGKMHTEFKREITADEYAESETAITSGPKKP